MGGCLCDVGTPGESMSATLYIPLHDHSAAAVVRSPHWKTSLVFRSCIANCIPCRGSLSVARTPKKRGLATWQGHSFELRSALLYDRAVMLKDQVPLRTTSLYCYRILNLPPFPPQQAPFFTVLLAAFMQIM